MATVYRCISCGAYVEPSRKRCATCGSVSAVTNRDACVERC